MQLIEVPAPRRTLRALEPALTALVDRQLKHFNHSDEPDWRDQLMMFLMVSYFPTTASPFPSALMRYLLHRKSDSAVHFLTRTERANHPGYLWLGLAYSGGLAVSGVNGVVPPPDPPHLPDILVALWRVVALGGMFPPIGIEASQILEQLSNVAPPSLSASLTLLIKYRYFEHLKRSSTFNDDSFSDDSFMINDHPRPTTILVDPLFPHDTAVRSEFLMASVGRDVEVRAGVEVRCGEGTIVALAEFLESCVQAEDLPYEAARTLTGIGSSMRPTAVHFAHQLRFSAAIRTLFASHRCSDLRSVLANHVLFDRNRHRLMTVLNPQYAWLDNTIARTEVRETFSAYADELSLDGNHSDDLDLEHLRAKLEELGDPVPPRRGAGNPETMVINAPENQAEG
ncbi:hypothetical protein C8R46DRAFT_1238506 [Mycena filopes]|nr:hypothetical protein C8R46DRAFT_1238506 [Mycena filopes]